jgi:hypothetical protein
MRIVHVLFNHSSEHVMISKLSFNCTHTHTHTPYIHIHPLLRTQVLRQLGVVGTSGSPHQKQGRGRKPSNVHKVKMGVEGEDVGECVCVRVRMCVGVCARARVCVCLWE